MTILQIPGKDNLVNLQNDPKIYYVLIIGALLSTISFAITKNPLTVILLIFTTTFIFLTLKKAPKDILISLNDENLDVGGNDISWTNVDSWAALSQNEWLEIVLKSTNLTKPYFTFYILQSHPKAQEFLTLLSERVSYDQAAITDNTVHTVLKKLGLR